MKPVSSQESTRHSRSSCQTNRDSRDNDVSTEIPRQYTLDTRRSATQPRTSNEERFLPAAISEPTASNTSPRRHTFRVSRCEHGKPEHLRTIQTWRWRPLRRYRVGVMLTLSGPWCQHRVGREFLRVSATGQTRGGDPAHKIDLIKNRAECATDQNNERQIQGRNITS